jgi:hypothetical protein
VKERRGRLLTRAALYGRISLRGTPESRSACAALAGGARIATKRRVKNRARGVRHFVAIFVWVVSATFVDWIVPSARALDPKEYAVDVACDVQVSPPALIFSWPRVDFARQYFVRRRTSPDSGWGNPIATLAADSTGFTDSNVNLGVRYEYEVDLQLTALGYDGNFINAYSYLCAGINVPAVDAKGKVLLVVDSAVAPALGDSLASFQQDLIGAGWSVIVRQADRNASPPAVKEMIRAEYYADPSNFRAVVLIGHVPVPYSGDIAPDFHDSHKGAWPADVYYADMNGSWTDNSVSVTSEDMPDNDNFPGDGKFDQSDIPAAIPIEIGRIDFATLPAFAPRSETDLLNTYFRKNHEFRNRLFTAPRRALVHDNFGDVDGDAPAVDAWRHFSGFFGHGAVAEIGPDTFVPTLNSQSYLWAYGCGGGYFNKADGVGSTAEFAAGDPQAVFYILHGSYFGDWNSEDNFLRAAMATPHMGLVSIWSGLPHWFLHHMALGSTVGYSTRITQNNLQTYKSYRNFFAGEVHIALMGDPTLEMFPVIPPNSLTATAGATVNLSWAPSGDENIVGYKVYHSLNPAGPFQPILPMALVKTSFSHTTGAGTHYYMVRAMKLERTGSGTFYNLSQGIFASAVKADTVPNLPPVAVSSSVETTQDSAVGVPLSGSDPEGAALSYRIVSGPAHGALSSAPPNVIYTPAPGYVGTDQFTFAVSDGQIESPPVTVSLTVKAAPPRVVSAIEISGTGTVVLHISGPPQHQFQVLYSTDFKNWLVAGEGVSDGNGEAEYPDPENGARFKLYRIFWP